MSAKSIFLLAAILPLTAARTDAAILFNQTAVQDTVASYTSSNIAGIQKMADNFVVPGIGKYTIRSLRVLGGYSDIREPLYPLPVDDFRVVFLSDLAGVPGTPVAGGDFSLPLVAKRAPLNAPLLNGVGRPIEFNLDLGNGITLDGETKYWLSVSNAPTPGSGWAWARAIGLSDQVLASTTNDVEMAQWNVGRSGGMYFELHSLSVPEPSSQFLIFSSLLTACCIWRKFIFAASA
jgi:hypothetical protein